MLWALLARCKASAGASVYCLARDDLKTGLLDRIDQAVFRNGLRVVEHAREPVTERHGCHPNAVLLFHETPNGVCAGVAVHAFNSEYGGFHPTLPSYRCL